LVYYVKHWELFAQFSGIGEKVEDYVLLLSMMGEIVAGRN